MTDLIVLVRYPDYVRRAVIRQSRYKPETRKRTKSGRPYAQVWHVVKWLDDTEAKSWNGSALSHLSSSLICSPSD